MCREELEERKQAKHLVGLPNGKGKYSLGDVGHATVAIPLDAKITRCPICRSALPSAISY
jgi:hypothetical protein